MRAAQLLSQLPVQPRDGDGYEFAIYGLQFCARAHFAHRLRNETAIHTVVSEEEEEETRTEKVTVVFNL